MVVKKMALGLMAGTFALSLPVMAQEAATPVEGGIVRFAFAEESRGMDPVTAHRRFSEAAIHVHESLVLHDTSNAPHPALAESWEANADASQYTVKLKSGVIFHDGTPFNAASVKAHFDRLFDPANCCSNGTQYMAGYTGTDIVDDQTVVITFDKPMGTFAHYIGMLDVTAIPSNAAWDEIGKDMNLRPVGAGPFKFVEWVPQSHVRFERNADYNWGSDLFDHPGAPYIDALEVKFIADQATRTACLEAGDCDIIKDPGFAAQVRLGSNPDYEMVKIPQTGMPYSFVFNTAKWPTDQLAVRKAINLAIDREKINMAAYLGQREPLYSTLAPATPEFWPEAPSLIYFAPDEAKALLAEAGFADTNGDGIVEEGGNPVAIDLFIFGNREGNPSVIVAESIQSDLAAVGIKVNINVRPWDDQSVVAMNEGHHMINFDMPLPTASVLGVMFNSRETPREGRYGMGFTYFQKASPDNSTELDALLDAGDNAATFEERKEKFIAAQKIIGENYLGVPISAGFTTYIMTNRLEGVKYNNAGHAMFNDAFLTAQ
ncbi:MAG: ABC transporter substrate-binding protein [Devosia sp.]